MSIEKNKEIIVNFWTNFLTEKAHEAFELLAEDSTWTVMGKLSAAQPGPLSKAQFMEQLRNTGAWMADDRAVGEVFQNGLRVSIKGIIAEGNRVAIEAESFADTKNGKKYNNVYHVLFELRDGKIQAVREYCDTHHQVEVMLDQLS